MQIKMKIFALTLLIGLVGTLATFAQAPQSFKYQTVVRNNAGELITNQVVSFQIGLLQDSINGTLVYSETHSDTTNQIGMVSFNVGNGTIITGIFEEISWGTSSYFLKIELDETGGTNYQLMGISQLLSVPYSLNASSLTLTNEKGDKYKVTIDSLGNLQTNLIVYPWKCGDKLHDIDGNSYNTVEIGNQCWMKENLKTTKYNNGTSIIYPGSSNSTWANNTTGAYAWYNNDIENKSTYGALYNWYAVNNFTELCPAGWHVPNNEDWTTLTDFIGGMGSPHGNELKSCRQINSPLGEGCNTTEHPRWIEHQTNFGTDDYGFSGLPGGLRFSDGFFVDVGGGAFWWSYSQASGYYGWYLYLYYFDSIMVMDNYFDMNTGFSVRCVKTL